MGHALDDLVEWFEQNAFWIGILIGTACGISIGLWING